MVPDADFWNQPETVAGFADREADRHLTAWVDALDAPPAGRVLDLGAAGGRNTVWLLDRGYQVLAVDFAPAMLAQIRQRTSGRPVALLRACMSALPVASGVCDGVAAIGVYHQAETDAMLVRSLTETRRMLRPGGWLVTSVFTPEMLSPGTPRVAGQRFLYETPDGPTCRVSAAELVELAGAAGLTPAREPETRKGPEGSGRVTMIGWFRAI